MPRQVHRADPYAWLEPALPLRSRREPFEFYEPWLFEAPRWSRWGRGEFAAWKDAWTAAHPPWYDPRTDLEMA